MESYELTSNETSALNLCAMLAGIAGLFLGPSLMDFSVALIKTLWIVPLGAVDGHIIAPLREAGLSQYCWKPIGAVFGFLAVYWPIILLSSIFALAGSTKFNCQRFVVRAVSYAAHFIIIIFSLAVGSFFGFFLLLFLSGAQIPF